MFADWPLLSLVIWTPIIGGILVLMAGDKMPDGARRLALFFSVLTFLISIPLFVHFDRGTHEMQFVELLPWISTFNVNYHLGVDGISMPLILLTTFATVLAIVVSTVFFRGMLGRLSILLGIIVGYLVAWAQGQVDFSKIGAARRIISI